MRAKNCRKAIKCNKNVAESDGVQKNRKVDPCGKIYIVVSKRKYQEKV